MFLRSWPVRFFITRAARAYGFLDPVALVAKLRGFAQPSEVGDTEFLRLDEFLRELRDLRGKYSLSLTPKSTAVNNLPFAS